MGNVPLVHSRRPFNRSGGHQIPGRYDELRGDFVFVQKGFSTPILEKSKTEPVSSKSVPNRTAKFLDLPFAEMAYVEGGTFQMGDPNGIQGYNKAHAVTVSSFLMGKYEITRR
ncbi:hypothetical protein GCM10023187_52900 [Nibrella viscosa]|uniref:Sulfatase-modifying factor enzyme-like domain-containing protein n=1 Tax=Nibrella viscosa TaxID=1084524 RepID=A0ABP8KZT3_9BACT